MKKSVQIANRVLAAEDVKTPGQKAYEAELEYCPNYHDGAPRRAWDQLPEYAQWSWERNPTPRPMKRVLPH